MKKKSKTTNWILCELTANMHKSPKLRIQMKIAKDHVVSIHYTLTDDKGTTLDSSIGADPLTYLHGLGHIIPGLENALSGKEKGDKFEITIKPEDAYGPRVEEMVQSVPKTEFQDVDQIQVGMQFQVDTEQGPMVLTVIEVKDNDLVLDGNHPLAGVTLNFDVEVSTVRAATAEELDHGHVHN